MAKMLFEKRHHQEGPDYETRVEAEDVARDWNAIGAIAHVEEVPLPRPNHRGEFDATD